MSFEFSIHTNNNLVVDYKSINRKIKRESEKIAGRILKNKKLLIIVGLFVGATAIVTGLAIKDILFPTIVMASNNMDMNSLISASVIEAFSEFSKKLMVAVFALSTIINGFKIAIIGNPKTEQEKAEVKRLVGVIVKNVILAPLIYNIDKMFLFMSRPLL